jgi:pyrimidine-specific ribonucleoside hydrolase
MGGAFDVPGNLGDGGAFRTGNKTAEWNIFVDPLAAQKVFAQGSVPGIPSGIQIRVIPLDATHQVPIHSTFLRQLAGAAGTPLAKSVAQILGTNREWIAQGFYSAWDPLAAVALVDSRVVQTRCAAVQVRQEGVDIGRTFEVPDKRPNACLAFSARRERFYQLFLTTLEPAVRMER